MNSLHLQELNFTLFIKDITPTLLNPNVLQSAGVIQSSWELMEEPVYNNNGAKLLFTNQVRIILQSNRLVFAETIGNKRLQDIHLPKMVRSLVQTFSNLEYQTAAINPSGYVLFNSDSEARQYMSDGLLASTSWQKFQGETISAVGLKLAYPYGSGNFYLDVNQANIEVSGTEVPAVWFAGNFSYQLFNNSSMATKSHLNNILQDWNNDIKNFEDFINDKLLNVMNIPSLSVFPNNN